MSDRNTTIPQSDNQQREIERLRGELSAATLAISYLFSVFRLIDAMTDSEELPRIVAKFMDGGVSADSLRIMEADGIAPDNFIEGNNRFNERLSKHLTKLLSHYSSD